MTWADVGLVALWVAVAVVTAVAVYYEPPSSDY